MIDETCCIIVPTNSKYVDICENFVEVFKKSWPDCPYNLVVSVTGEDKKIAGVANIYNGADASLIDCIINASNTYRCDYYMIFLGDAFMCGVIDTYRVRKLLGDMKENKLDFCCLHPEKSRMKIMKVGDQMRYIHINDRYCHCFGYTLCSEKYIKKMFVESGIMSDLEYEMWYLNKTAESKSDYYYEHDAIVTSNIFNIRCGIKKGKWDRVAYRWIKRNYPDIQLANRQKLSIMSQVVMLLREHFLYLIPNGLRVLIKKNISRLLRKNPVDTMN